MTTKALSLVDLQKYGATQEQASKIATILQEEANRPQQCWQRLTNEALEPDMPASLHQYLFQAVYNQDEKFTDAPPAWFPSNEDLTNSNVAQFMKQLGFENYEALHKWSVTNRLAFWELMIKELNIHFDTSYEAVGRFDNGIEKPEWLPGAAYNIVDSCLKTRPERTAIVYGGPQEEPKQMTFGELETLVNRIANGLQHLGLKKGDRVAINMPMTANAVAAYLGIVKMGGAVVSIADSLAANEVEKRLKIADTKAVVTQDVVARGGKEIPLYAKLKEGNIPQSIVIPGKQELDTELRAGDVSWAHFLSDDTSFQSVKCQPEDYCNILFSSGTTGDPKAIPWTQVTPIKCAADGYLHHDIKEDDLVAWPTNIGWMMGPWLIFASFINNAPLALFYGAPTGWDFGKFVQDAGINMLGLVPSMVKRWLETDCMKGLDWSNIKVYSSTGESSNPQDYLWLMARAGYKPVIEYCGGTEIGGGYFTGTVVQNASPATFSTPALGLDVMIIDDEGRSANEGELFIIPPSMGLSNSLLNKDHQEVYYANVPKVDKTMEGSLGTPIGDQVASLELDPILRRHGDEVAQTPNGYFRAQGRADDTMNIGGIKTSSVEIERILDLIEGVKETAAIAVEPKGGGPSQLVIYVVLQEGMQTHQDDLQKSFQKAIKEQLNPLFKVSDVVVTDVLPRTASNKIMRRILRQQYNEQIE